MTLQIASLLISSITAIVVAVIGAQTKRSAANNKQLADGICVMMELTSANTDLSLVTAKAVTGQHLNGDVAASMDAAAKARGKYDDYCRGVLSKGAAGC